ncbi:hypothetical protein OHJ21_07075 [Virgibacillus sp. LDC1]|uniref:hypothetical protein n=1 Tax=Paenibacillus lautus TaxID=1401 RepID=UPI002DBB1B53|nr:hypothetical protein [Paenibacillus lautus]MCV4230932.1 hypothetical protein [Virgibacillus sp. LDC1]MEC0311058.1 hypothetical protein [Paenibacillus lautus]
MEHRYPWFRVAMLDTPLRHESAIMFLVERYLFQRRRQMEMKKRHKSIRDGRLTAIH